MGPQYPDPAAYDQQQYDVQASRVTLAERVAVLEKISGELRDELARLQEFARGVSREIGL